MMTDIFAKRLGYMPNIEQSDIDNLPPGPLGGWGVCSLCGNRWGLHHLFRITEPGFSWLRFECLTGRMPPVLDYDPRMPYWIKSGLGQKLTPGERRAFIRLEREANGV